MSINAIKTFQDFIILNCDRISYFLFSDNSDTCIVVF